jgi:hypothetical protein
MLLLQTTAARDKGARAVAACEARGGNVAGGRPHRRGVAGGDHATIAFPRVRGPGHAAMGQRGPLASGP